MNTLLQINTSIFASAGQSSQLSRQFVERWRATNPDGQVLVRDLGTDPLPHLDAERFAAFRTAPEDRTPEQRQHVAVSDALIEELRAADEIVIGLPMYNFGVPSALKAYFDHIARAGVTFRYTANGPEGLLGGRKVFVLAARGGSYAGTSMDVQTEYVRIFLSFIGLDDVEFVYAEGLARGEESRQHALDEARATIAALAA